MRCVRPKRLVEAVQFAERDRSVLQRDHVFDDGVVIGGVRRAPRERIESCEHVIGWFAGLIVLWSSRAWTTRDEWIGGLIIPGGLTTVALVALTAVGLSSCEWSSDSAGVSVWRIADGSTLPCGGQIRPPQRRQHPHCWCTTVVVEEVPGDM
jgi:hypothetical protein